MLKTTNAILEQLEMAIIENDKQKARMIVMACRYAIQCHVLDFAKAKFEKEIERALPSLSEED